MIGNSGDGELVILPGGVDGIFVWQFANRPMAIENLAAEIRNDLNVAIGDRGRGLWVGAGGGTPKGLYEHLAAEGGINWEHVTLTQVDERFVEVTDERSNTRMMRKALGPVLEDGIGPGLRFLSLIEDITDSERNAEEVERTLRKLGAGVAPVFDFSLLGMGGDGHYASIFPGHPINELIYDAESLVLPVAPAADGSEPVWPRITMTVPAINSSRRIVFLITGHEKLDTLRRLGANTNKFASPIGAFLAQCPVPVEFAWAP